MYATPIHNTCRNLIKNNDKHYGWGGGSIFSGTYSTITPELSFN
jgi:hypothetical protein